MIKNIQKTNFLGIALALLGLLLVSLIAVATFGNNANAATFGNTSSGITVTLNPNPSFDVTVTATRQESSGVTDSPETNYNTDTGKWVIGPIEAVGTSISCTGGTTTTNNANTRRNTFNIEVKDKATGKTVSSPAITQVNFCNDNPPTYKDITINTVSVANATQVGKVTGTLLYVASDGTNVPFGTSANAKITCDGVVTGPIKVSDNGLLTTTSVAVKAPDGSTCLFEANWQPTNSSIGTTTQFISKQVLIKPGQTVSINETSKASTDPSLDPATATKDAATDSQAACDDGLSPFGWVLCPIINIADNAYKLFIDLVNELLFFDSSKFDTGNLQKTSHLFVNLANVAIVLFALLMIAAQIFSFEIFSAYTVKKVLPRIVIGAILIQLSWPIFTLMIELVNAIGSGLYWMLMAPFGFAGTGFVELGDIIAKNAQSAANGAASAGVAGATVLGVGLSVAFITAAGAWLSIVVAGIGVLISVLIGILTLVLRQVILIVLLAIAPLALAFWIFPGTKRYWDMWWKSFSRLLLMYPLIMLLIAGGAMAASILSSAGTLYSNLFAIIAYFAPIFLIGATYKFAGEAFGAINGMTGKLGNKARGAGYFGLRDHAKLNKDNSAWTLSRKSRDSDRVRSAQLRQAGTLTGSGAYSRYIRHRSGSSTEGRNRALANAATAITSAHEQEYKERAALAEYAITEIVKGDKTAGRSLYDKQVIARSQILSSASGQRAVINGHSVMITDDLKADTAIEALKYKDGSSETRLGATGLSSYINSADGFNTLATLGSSSGAAYETLAKRLPTAAKGAPDAHLTALGTLGFDDALKGYGDLASPQQTEVRSALLAHMSIDPNAVVSRLSDIARSPNVTQTNLEAINGTMGGGLDLAALRSNPTGTLVYNSGTKTFSVT